MLARACLCALVLSTVASATGSVRQSQKVTPVEKVIELLTKLSAQVADEGKQEAAQYDKTACFCKEQADDKLYAIETSKEKIKMLNAKIGALEALIAQLNAKITELTQKIADLEEAIKNLVAERSKAHMHYLLEAKDMDDAISAMQRAIKALKDSKGEMTDAKLDFAQLRALGQMVLLTMQRSSKVRATDSQLAAVETLAKQDPAAYEYHSNDIIATLEGLLVQFKENKKELDESEFNARSAFEKEKLNMENEKKFAEKELAETETLLGQKEDELADAKSELQEEEKDMAADQSFLNVLTENCENQAKLFDQRSSTRSAELTAISTAMEKLETGTQPNYDANKKLVELQKGQAQKAPEGHAISFLQRGSASQVSREPLNRALALIEGEALRLRSAVLSTLSVKARSEEDHFVKVRSIIKDFIKKLETDAEAEAETKSYCDKAMQGAIEDRDDSTAHIEKYTAKITNIETKLKVLAGEIKVLGEQIAELYKALNEATELREDEKATNMRTIADSQAGLGSTKFAVSVLEDFYNSAFLQRSGRYTPPNSDRDGNTVGDLAPPQLEGEYHGNQDASKGIIGLLEVIISDFERTIETTTAAEKAAQEEFEKFKAKTEEDIADKEKSKSTKEAKVADLTDELNDTKGDLKDELETKKLALSELEHLKGMCVEQPEDWEAMNKKRTEEIEALKQAMTILDEWQKPEGSPESIQGMVDHNTGKVTAVMTNN